MHNNVQEILTLNYNYKAAAFSDKHCSFVASALLCERNIMQHKIFAYVCSSSAHVAKL